MCVCRTSPENAPFPKHDMNHLPTQTFSEGKTCETFGLYQGWTLNRASAKQGLPMWMKKIFIPIILYQAGTEHCLEDHPMTCKWLIALVSKSRDPNYLLIGMILQVGTCLIHLERDLPACLPHLFSERQMTTIRRSPQVRFLNL